MKNILILLFVLICLIILIILANNIIKWKLDSDKIVKQVKNIQEIVEIKEVEETENTLWQIFSIYHIPTTNDYIQVEFYSAEEFNNWSTKLISKSLYNFHTTINKNDNILTLSTCYNDNQKVYYMLN